MSEEKPKANFGSFKAEPNNQIPTFDIRIIKKDGSEEVIRSGLLEGQAFAFCEAANWEMQSDGEMCEIYMEEHGGLPF